MRFACGVAAFALVAGLVGCSPAPPTAPGSSPSGSSPSGAVDEAIARTEAAPTFRYTVHIEATGSGRPVSLQASGVFDRDAGLFTVSTDLSAIDPDLGGPLTIIATDDVLFVDCSSLARLLHASTRWISAKGAAAGTLRSSVIDPVQVLHAAARGGTAPTASGASSEVVVGDDGFVRRVSVRFDAANLTSEAVVTVEFSGVGSPVDGRPPAPDEVTDETDALNRLLGGSTGG